MVISITASSSVDLNRLDKVIRSSKDDKGVASNVRDYTSPVPKRCADCLQLRLRLSREWFHACVEILAAVFQMIISAEVADGGIQLRPQKTTDISG